MHTKSHHACAWISHLDPSSHASVPSRRAVLEVGLMVADEKMQKLHENEKRSRKRSRTLQSHMMYSPNRNDYIT
eukprot:672899-Amphidinium_carterae.1